MEFLEGYIVSSNSQKRDILANESLNKGFKNYKFLSVNELKDKVLGKCEKEGILYLLKKHPDISIYSLVLYLRYLPYIEIKEYGNSKLDFLVSLKKELIDNGYYTIDNLFINMVNKSNLTFYRIQDTRDIMLLLSHLKTNAYFNHGENEVTDSIDYYEFQTIEQELDFVIKSINQLISNKDLNIGYENIKICNAGSDYTFLLNRFKASCNLPIVLKEEKNYLIKKSAKLFLSLLEEYDNFNDLFDHLKDNISAEDYIYYVSIVNDYKGSKYKPIDLKDVIKYELENKSYKSKDYESKIELINISDIKEHLNDYIFFVNFDMNVPETVKDNNYLSDNELEILKLDTSALKTKHNKEELIHALREAKNLVITYSKTHAFASSIKSSLVDELGLKPSEIGQTIVVDPITDSINIARDLDMFDKYGIKSPNFDLMFDVKYKSYDNRFKGLDKDNIDYILQKPINLSYTSMDSYFSCPFSYYLGYILKLNVFEDSLAISLGNIAHKIFEDSYNDDFDYDTSLKNAIAEMLNKSNRANKKLTGKEEYYIERLNKAVENALYDHKIHEETLKLDKVLTENKFVVNINDHLNFIGKIDKIYYSNSLKQFIVIDYKTGKKDASLDNLEDGFNMQLPSYLYLIENGTNTSSGENLKEFSPIGMYLEKIKINKNNLFDDFKFNGFTSEISTDIDTINPRYLPIKFNKDGKPDKRSQAKLLSKDEFNKLISIVRDNIDKFNQGIETANFKIKNSCFNKESKCDNCPMNDICFKTYGDKEEIEKKPFKKREENTETKEEGEE